MKETVKKNYDVLCHDLRQGLIEIQFSADRMVGLWDEFMIGTEMDQQTKLKMSGHIIRMNNAVRRSDVMVADLIERWKGFYFVIEKFEESIRDMEGGEQK